MSDSPIAKVITYAVTEPVRGKAPADERILQEFDDYEAAQEYVRTKAAGKSVVAIRDGGLRLLVDTQGQPLDAAALGHQVKQREIAERRDARAIAAEDKRYRREREDIADKAAKPAMTLRDDKQAKFTSVLNKAERIGAQLLTAAQREDDSEIQRILNLIRSRLAYLYGEFANKIASLLRMGDYGGIGDLAQSMVRAGKSAKPTLRKSDDFASAQDFYRRYLTLMKEKGVPYLRIERLLDNEDFEQWGPYDWAMFEQSAIDLLNDSSIDDDTRTTVARYRDVFSAASAKASDKTARPLLRKTSRDTRMFCVIRDEWGDIESSTTTSRMSDVESFFSEHGVDFADAVKTEKTVTDPYSDFKSIQTTYTYQRPKSEASKSARPVFRKGYIAAHKSEDGTACLCLSVDAAAAKALRACLTEAGDALTALDGDLRIVLAHLPEDVGNKLGTVTTGLQALASTLPDLSGSITGWGRMSIVGEPDTDVVFATFDSPDLAALRQGIVNVFNDAAVSADMTAGFAPRIELAHIAATLSTPSLPLPDTTELVFDGLTFRRGGKESLVAFGQTSKVAGLYDSTRPFRKFTDSQFNAALSLLRKRGYAVHPMADGVTVSVVRPDAQAEVMSKEETVILAEDEADNAQ